jgi:colanic acid biosynthesis protein WcaH
MASNLSELLEELLTYVPNAKVGLPQEIFYFISQLTPMINVDLLIKNKNGKTLLTWRDDKFYGPAWHIPGGIIRFKEQIKTRIDKVAETELGCTVRFNPEPLSVHNLINNERDVRGHFVSMLFLCELTSNPDIAKKCNSNNPSHGEWAWHDGAPINLIKPHEIFRRFVDETPPL